jgi:hypothetical protein
MCMPTKPEPLNLGVPVVNFPRANAILARAQALLWVRDWWRGVNPVLPLPKKEFPLLKISLFLTKIPCTEEDEFFLVV